MLKTINDVNLLNLSANSGEFLMSMQLMILQDITSLGKKATNLIIGLNRFKKGSKQT
jgi:hypothetical protein